MTAQSLDSAAMITTFVLVAYPPALVAFWIVLFPPLLLLPISSGRRHSTFHLHRLLNSFHGMERRPHVRRPHPQFILMKVLCFSTMYIRSITGGLKA